MIELGWHDRAACLGEDPNRFYLDEFEHPDAIRLLRAICERCPVIAECRDHALTWEQFGFWANMTESERVVEKRKHGIVRRSMRSPRSRF